jgi:signal transduction histidine kinase
MIAYLSYLIYSVFFSDRFQASSLTRRIQSTVILLLLLSIAAVGITSSKLVSSQFDKDNEKQLLEKSNTILSELSGLLQKSDTITDISKELIDLTIKKYAYVFNSEISIFDNSGSLYITSQPRLYELGLAAPLLNSEALHHLKNDLASSFCSRDKAGNLNYLSLYAPIYSANKKLLGYLNLPYFGKQSELINELSGIISTLINVYVILFIISILSGLILSGYITLPLRILKQQMAKVTLGTKNEAIAWQSDDEVGKLVMEYNAMIEKLEKSAGLLAKSERELAWREMAKQVAHEIKNPLTPMKLNLQYLQHVIKNNPDDFEERFTKASNNIIEQIDTLANIATEFSNFAKLPSGELEKVDLAEIIHSTVDLFEKENNITIKVNLHTPNLFVLADKEQMLRVFNNLLKNAIQATTDVSDPHIQINSKAYEDLYLIAISDNGCGIPESLKQKIFTPNFTTKSTGSGLGLAMIKNIFDTIQAKIWFESEENKGSIFYLEFKQIND